MNLIIDIGNTQFKVCIFDHNKIVYHTYTNNFDKKFFDKLKEENAIDRAIYSDTRGINTDEFKRIFNNSIPVYELKSTSKLPIQLDYKTPETLGKDRIAGAVGATTLFGGFPCLIIDIGTALTIDFLSADAIFKGGIISPGPELRFKALHQFTGKLPLVEAVDETKDLGDSTQSAIQFGVQNGIAYEINGYISRFKQQYSNLKIIMTGGYAFLFDKKINYPIFADSFLVPKGLNRILIYNDLQK